jgi:hypothetical protein
LDPSEVDRIAHLTGVPLMRLVDWKNRSSDPFELRCIPKEGGAFRLELNTPIPTVLEIAVPTVHGDYESRKEDDGTLVYRSLPGNSMGQVHTNDGKPAFGVAFDCTELDAEGRPSFKVYFGSATEWFVKNAYHARWNELRDAKNEIEPDAPKPASDAPQLEGKERGRNPRDRARAQQRGGGGQQGGQPQGGSQQGGEDPNGGRARRGRRGGRGRGRA